MVSLFFHDREEGNMRQMKKWLEIVNLKPFFMLVGEILILLGGKKRKIMTTLMLVALSL
jgi:hypothetical protein